MPKTEVATTATPGPWTVSGWTSHGRVINAAKDAEGIGCGKYIGYAQGYPHPDDHECTMEEATANADLIVRAVNSYAPMLEFIKSVVQHDHARYCSPTACVATCVNGRAAISLAEEKK